MHAAAAAAGTVTLQVLSSNPLDVCWTTGGSQRPAGILAGVVLAVVLLGMPLVTLGVAWMHVRHQRVWAKPLRTTDGSSRDKQRL